MLAVILALVLGFVAGRILTVRQFARSPITEVQDTRPAVPVFSIDGTEDGNIVGQVTGTLRILVAGTAVEIRPGEDVSIPLSTLPAVVTVEIPEGMRFVASKNGKKYYEVLSAQGKRIIPANRVYFRDEAEAEVAGYER
jgi:hypothetical protein